ncbi:MAPEG family protein [Brevundimonas aurifodinae]|jgi:hypothetical protein|uniref:MAPEG family protein n=2 Tax=Brevundimonas TaxID=41275 RepID=A0ABV1NRR1_9CAUL|nr:MAG: glutathione S-transferase [Brevundimonas sp. 12-68-7]OYX33753.1 MAG: glutathione S-transferase [Brevundimonas subvibrioides]
MAFDGSLSGAEAAALWSGLLLLLLVILSMRVALTRRSRRVVLGDGGDPDLALKSRVFGNAAEYIPVGVGAMAILAVLGMPAVGIHMVGVPLLLGRVLHAAGLRGDRATMARVFGILLTWLALFLAAMMLIVHAFVAPH